MEVLQLGATFERQSLTLSNSFVPRRRPLYGVDFTVQSSPYISHLVSLQHGSSSSLLSYTDDGALRVHDKSTLDTQILLTWPNGAGCTSFAPVEGGFLAAGRNGQVGYWDLRQPVANSESPTTSLAGPSRAPYLAVASSGTTIAAGTELHGSDATIDIWDSRKSDKPVLSYEETHSDDVTYLSFHPRSPFVLLSASSDALVAVSDTRQADEDDSVLGVVNTGASVARIGWGGSSRKFARAADVDDANDNPTTSTLLDGMDLGAFYSISDMQTIGIWEADGFSELLPVRDVRQTHVPANGTFKAWEPEFVIDATTDASLLQNSESIAVFCGEQSGGLAMIEIPNALDEHSDAWSLHYHAVGGHNELVRSVSWDVGKSLLFTGGEDGHLCAWALTEQAASVRNADDEAAETSYVHDITTSQSTLNAATGPTRHTLSAPRGFSLARTTKEGQRHAGKPY